MTKHKQFNLIYVFYGMTILTGIFALVTGFNENTISQLIEICTMSSRVYTSYFLPDGVSGAFLNSFLVQIVMCIFYTLRKQKIDGVSFTVYVLTVGFTYWGINIINMWFGMFGVLLYCLVRKENPRNYVNQMLLTTGVSPLFTELLFHHPLFENNNLLGLIVTIVVGMLVGFVLPPLLQQGLKLHRGMCLYNGAWPAMWCAIILYALFYPGFLNTQLSVNTSYLDARYPFIATLYCLLLFVGMLILGLYQSKEKMISLIKNHQDDQPFLERCDSTTVIGYTGLYGLCILLYYTLIGAPMNGVTFGCIFCMLAICANGSHIFHIVPIMLGYIITIVTLNAVQSFSGVESTVWLSSQSMVVGLCFASGMAPLVRKYGIVCGILAGIIHCLIVTLLPHMHGYFCLYNGGFTAILVCIILIQIYDTLQQKKLD